jgi:hypothetical protein
MTEIHYLPFFGFEYSIIIIDLEFQALPSSRTRSSAKQFHLPYVHQLLQSSAAPKRTCSAHEVLQYTASTNYEFSLFQNLCNKSNSSILQVANFL